MDKTAIVIILIIILGGGLFWAWQSGFLSRPAVEPVPIPEGILLFYGEGCSYCKIVDDFIAQNDIESKVEFKRLEVWYNEDNQNVLAQVVQKCGIVADQVGVPLLYDGDGRCYIGGDEVPNFLKNAAGIQ